MTFAMPFFAWVAGGVALATVALHLLAWRRPPESPLPTARFAPERPIRMVSRAVRPADLGLLALRALLVLLVGFALAGPVVTPAREGTARVIVVDQSRSAASGEDVMAAARGAFRSGDAVVVFDSSAREIASPAADSITMTRASQAVGSISAALVVANRAARRLARHYDSVAVVLVSPFTADELDAATVSIRRTWNGPVQLIRVGGAPNDTASPALPQLRAAPGDPVAIALALGGAMPGRSRVRVVRDALTPSDSASAREGNAVVLWPAVVPAAWERRAAADTAYGVATVGSDPTTVVATFPRAAVTPAGRVVARWSDGEPAVTEAALGGGCLRAVSIPVPAAGDLILTPAFRRFVQRVSAPCGDGPIAAPVSDSVLARVLPAPGSADEPQGVDARAGSESRRTLVAWLLGLALAAAVAEMFVRRGGSHAAA